MEKWIEEKKKEYFEKFPVNNREESFTAFVWDEFIEKSLQEAYENGLKVSIVYLESVEHMDFSNRGFIKLLIYRLNKLLDSQ